MALEFIHLRGIIHRDIKPANLMLDEKKYLRLGDFGLSEHAKRITTANTSGTISYMAPEVICGQMHGIASDYYSLGVVCYECMLGERPYGGKNRKEVRENILAKQVQIKKEEIPEDWSLEAADFINRLLQRKPVNRLGLNGPLVGRGEQEVKNHVWLKSFPWEKLKNKMLISPFEPSIESERLKSEDSSNSSNSSEEYMKHQASNLRRDSVQSNLHSADLFATFSCASVDIDSRLLSNKLAAQPQKEESQSEPPDLDDADLIFTD